MSLDTSKKILKIAGIITIIAGAVLLLSGLLMVLGLSQVTEEEAAANVDMVGGGILLTVIIIASAVFSLLEGIFSVRASNDTSKIMPAWIFAIISSVSALISVFTTMTNGSGASSILSAIVTLALNLLIFYAANTIKKANAA